MPRKPVSNEEWLSAKQTNFLLFLIGLCDKYECFLGSPVQKIRTRVEDLNKDETKKAMYFSTLARKQLMLLEVFNEKVCVAKRFS